MQRWYQSFFNETALDVWQQSRTLEMTAAEATYLARSLGCEAPARLVDLACGNGRHAALLASAGFEVTGVDITEANRERVHAMAATHGASIDFVCADMSELSLETTFDAAYCFGNSLGYFPRDAMRSFFAGVASALRPGARFIVETSMAAESILVDLGRQSWTQISESTRVLLESSYDTRASRLDTTYTTIVDGVVTDESTAHVWVFTSGELIDMARGAGLEVFDLHGDLDGNAYELGDDRLLLTLERQA